MWVTILHWQIWYSFMRRKLTRSNITSSPDLISTQAHHHASPPSDEACGPQRPSYFDKAGELGRQEPWCGLGVCHCFYCRGRCHFALRVSSMDETEGREGIIWDYRLIIAIVDLSKDGCRVFHSLSVDIFIQNPCSFKSMFEVALLRRWGCRYLWPWGERITGWEWPYILVVSAVVVSFLPIQYPSMCW